MLGVVVGCCRSWVLVGVFGLLKKSFSLELFLRDSEAKSV